MCGMMWHVLQTGRHDNGFASLYFCCTTWKDKPHAPAYIKRSARSCARRELSSSWLHPHPWYCGTRTLSSAFMFCFVFPLDLVSNCGIYLFFAFVFVGKYILSPRIPPHFNEQVACQTGWLYHAHICLQQQRQQRQ